MTVALPTVSHAQSALTGVVRDDTGAVLTGVTVEPESLVLIERVRSAVTDNTGQYRTVDLRLGTYTLTTLPGFKQVKMQGLVLETDRMHRHGERNAGGRPDRGIGHRHWRVPRRKRLTRGAVISGRDPDRKE
jgi:hypothetical protein